MRILIIDPQFEAEPDVERSVTGPEAEIVVWRTAEQGPVPREEFAACNALINCRSRHGVTREIVNQMTQCRIVSQAGVGFNHIDLVACAERGIPVCNAPDYGTTEVADHALGLVLALTRGIVTYDAKLRKRTIGWDARAQPTVRRLRGASFGVLGLGRIGTAAAMRARGFEMDHRVLRSLPPRRDRARLRISPLRDGRRPVRKLRYHQRPHPADRRDSRNHRPQDTGRSRPGLVLVNTSRGGTTDLDAVEAALRDGQLGGIGLDVLPTEPIDYAHPLLKAFEASEDWLDGRMIITPHAAFYSPDSVIDMRRIATENVVTTCNAGCVGPA